MMYHRYDHTNLGPNSLCLQGTSPHTNNTMHESTSQYERENNQHARDTKDIPNTQKHDAWGRK